MEIEQNDCRGAEWQSPFSVGGLVHMGFPVFPPALLKPGEARDIRRRCAIGIINSPRILRGCGSTVPENPVRPRGLLISFAEAWRDDSEGSRSMNKAEPRRAGALPETMLAAVYRGRGRIRIERLPVPQPGPGEALVRVDTCGVCATDLKKVEYGLVPPPRVFGHETAGTIAALGPGVRGWRVGDRVAVFHHIPCRACFYCARRDYAQCAGYRKTGTTAGFEPAGGGFAQYVRVLPWIVRRGMVRVPPRVPLEWASFIEPVNTCLKGVERLAPRRGEEVLVFGQGAIGLIFTQLVRRAGARATGLDLLAPRRRLALRLGAVRSDDPRRPGCARRILAATGGRGADAAILAVPSEAALDQALRWLRPGGRVLLFAHTRKGERVAFDAGLATVEDKALLGCYSADADLQDLTARLVFSRRVRVAPLVSHRFPLARAAEAFDLAMHPTSRSLKILVKP
jgi:L-iditol 2-dehydrogenase